MKYRIFPIICSVLLLSSCYNNNSLLKHDDISEKAFSGEYITKIYDDQILYVDGVIRNDTQISQFFYDYNSDICEDDGIISSLFSSLDYEEIEELYYRGFELMLQFSTENINIPSDSCTTKIIINEQNSELKNKKFFETGYSTESFVNAYLSVFTEDMTKSLFEYYPIFIDYNNEIWALGTSYSSNGFIVHREYEIISESSNDISFNIINYQMNNDTFSERYEYFPEKEREYTKVVFEFEFINSNNGWRISKCPFKWI